MVTYFAEGFPEEDGHNNCSVMWIMENGEVKACGYNQSGYFGIGNIANTSFQSPRLIPLPDSVRSVISDGVTTFFLMKDKTLWSAGHNGQGQCGVGTSGSNVLVPTQVNNIQNVKKVAVSEYG